MITAADIIDNLGGNPNTGMCHCPEHDDTKPSLRVSDGGGGKILVHCKGGCSQEDVIAALKALGLWPTASNNRDMRDQKREQSEEEFESFRKAFHILQAAAQAEAGPPKAYLEGRKINLVPACAMILPAGETARLTGKRYPAMVLPITNELDLLQGTHLTWLCADATAKLAVSDDRPRRMFGKAKGGFVQFASSEPNRPLIIGEGVETVLSAMQLTNLPGIAALSSSNLMAINPPVASGYIIAGDHDANGVGQQGARVLAGRLAGRGLKVRLALPPKPGSDWNDALCSGEDREALRKALVEAPWFKSVEGPGSVGMSEFKALQFPQRRALMGRWLTTTGIAMIYGEPGAMKTRLAMSIGYAVATGAPLLGWECEHRARVMFVDGEMPGELLQQWIDELGPALPDTDFRILAHSILAAQGVEMPDLGTQEGRDFLDADIERNKPELITLDLLSTLVRSGEDNTVEAWRVVQQWSLKHRQQGRTILFLHHTNKTGGLRGSGSREVTADTVIRLKLLPDLSDDEETAIELSFTKGRAIFGRDKVPQILRMSTASGLVEWTGAAVPPREERPNQSPRVEEMLLQGCETDAITAETGLSKGRVSQIRRRLIKEGRLAA